MLLTEEFLKIIFSFNMPAELFVEEPKVFTGEIAGQETTVCWVDYLRNFPTSRKGKRISSREIVLGLPTQEWSENPHLVITGNREGQTRIVSSNIQVNGESRMNWRLFSSEEWAKGQPQVVPETHMPLDLFHALRIAPFIHDGRMVYEGRRIFDVNTVGLDFIKVIAERTENPHGNKLQIVYYPDVRSGVSANIGFFERVAAGNRWALVSPTSK